MGLHIISTSANNRYGFPKQARLLRSAEFRNVYDHGRRRSLDCLLVFMLPNGKSWSRIGLTVPRAVGGSVERNRIKRRLREAVRKRLAELGPGWDVIFNARPSVQRLTLAALEEAVGKLFASLRLERAACDAESRPGSLKIKP